ncbi:mechanosensitive ion channel domain-containing protein [Aurantimonas sp. VKM B-3413]|uniref:mechanosensitive ion channel domain-containing protein n=1 Tax=Aurantimonas sp. VKM B-3413 TaxID=2779401 RepID=UPI001E3C2652|nr:mechanosensitive ion channel domain-containing protein [Aurantimonas sp. VKM B-3413]MCB8840228.1 mechanosensitive ion channel [Aurantimonas sp. VKM B-3413]
MNSLLMTAFVGLAGIAVWHLIPERRVNTRLIAQIPFFLAMSAMLLAWHILPTAPPDGQATTSAALLVGVVKLLWWLHLAWAIIGVVSISLVIEHKPREARLLQQVVIGVVYAGTVLSILAFVFAVPIATLIATSGAIAVVLGLALQSTLADVFSGIALNLGRPFRLGDWVVLSDGTEGRVIETNWRATLLLGFPNNVVVLPNSVLAKLGITNVSTPDETHGLSINVRVAPTRSPAAVVDVMKAVLQSCDLIVREPPPAVAIRGLDSTVIEVGLIFRVSDVGKRLAAMNDIYDLLYRHVRSAGLVLAVQGSTLVAMTDLPPLQARRNGSGSAPDLIAAMPVFAELEDAELRTLTSTATSRTFQNEDVIARLGDVLPSPMIVRSGIVARQRDDAKANVPPFHHLAPGDILGAGSILFDRAEDSTSIAVGHVTVLEFDRDFFASLLVAHPELANSLADLLPSGATGPDAAERPPEEVIKKPGLLGRIKSVMVA